jgi:serine/threonine protein kinase
MDEYLNLGFKQGLTAGSGTTYVSLQRLGRGGTAETYLVLATSGPSWRGQLFALKIFRRISKPDWRANFLGEIAFLRTCNHPAVMRVFDEGLYLEDRPFVVVEYLPQTLAGVLGTAPSMVERLSYTLQLLSALEYLARPEVSVVHRDVKPPNIFIKGGACVLGDFGLVKHLKPDPDADREMLKESLGPRMPRFYRTPDLVEYLKGGPAPTPKSDVFQLGLVLAEMFTGSNPQVPLPGNDFTAPVQLDPLGYIPGGMGKMIKDAIEPMLDPSPDTRPSASELLGRWQELFLEAAKRAHALEGRVF